MSAPARIGWECHAQLRIFGFDGSPDAVSTILGIRPSRSWLAGDPNIKGPLRRQSGWVLKSGLALSDDPSQQVRWLLDRVVSKMKGLTALGEGWSATVLCAIYLTSSTPPLYFEPSLLRAITELPAALDIDLYLLPREAEQ